MLENKIELKQGLLDSSKTNKKFNKIYIEITNICNLKCDFCPETNRNKQSMEIENFEKIIKKIYKYTNLVCLHVKGEPLLHNQLADILKILEKYKLKANITTNGTLIKQKLEIIKNAKSVRQINFSLHSMNQNENVQEKYLNEIFDSVEELKNIIVSYRLWNLKNIKENEININIIQSIGEYYGINNLKQKLMENDFIKLRNNLFINQDIEFSWPNINKPIIIERGRCLALKEQIAILVDGTVVPCCLDNNGDIPLGNILEEELEEILQKPKSANIKKNFENGIITCDFCKTCGFLKRLENKRVKNNRQIKKNIVD